MGRELKRVPMEFEQQWPIGKVWIGYDEGDENGELYDPPEGEGYQMWETTTEGSPQTPVFATLSELAEYCAKYCTTFADIKATIEEWEALLSEPVFIVRDPENPNIVWL